MSRPRTQYCLLDNGEVVAFTDRGERRISAKCQPRDLCLLDMAQDDAVIEEICIDIRRGQGYPDVGIAKNLLWE